MANGRQADDMDMEVEAEAGRDAPRTGGRRLMSTVETAHGRSTKGRGNNFAHEDRMAGHFDKLDDTKDSSVALKSVEGWVLFVTGVHAEAATEDIQDAFADYGEVKNTWLNLDRQTGFIKGYALVEYAAKEEAEAAIEKLDGTEILGEPIAVSWAFVKREASRRGGPRRR